MTNDNGRKMIPNDKRPYFIDRRAWQKLVFIPLFVNVWIQLDSNKTVVCKAIIGKYLAKNNHEMGWSLV
ncbi:MAG TPA: hypothetical protein VFD60_00980 [Nitrososphaeraceae archaeon]|jgi:hypothetical protein|nr:hypothetical protein [Nitrososphaeraceae archaeon]